MLLLGLPICALSSFAGIFSPKLSNDGRKLLTTKMIPWACKIGKESKIIMACDIEKLLDKPINEVREYLNLEPFKM